jgi:hypothetical protein
MIIEQFEEAAILYLEEIHPMRVFFDPDVDRVRFQYEDPHGHAARIIGEHRNGSLRVPSDGFVRAMKWARGRIYATRPTLGRAAR